MLSDMSEYKQIEKDEKKKDSYFVNGEIIQVVGNCNRSTTVGKRMYCDAWLACGGGMGRMGMDSRDETSDDSMVVGIENLAGLKGICLVHWKSIKWMKLR